MVPAHNHRRTHTHTRFAQQNVHKLVGEIYTQIYVHGFIAAGDSALNGCLGNVMMSVCMRWLLCVCVCSDYTCIYNATRRRVVDWIGSERVTNLIRIYTTLTRTACEIHQQHIQNVLRSADPLRRRRRSSDRKTLRFDSSKCVCTTCMHSRKCADLLRTSALTMHRVQQRCAGVCVCVCYLFTQPKHARTPFKYLVNNRLRSTAAAVAAQSHG